jgi:superfamily I DNA/RNA helicase
MKRHRDPIKWHFELATDEEQRRIRAKLGLSEEATNDHWELPANSLDPIETEIVARSERFAHLKGLTAMSTSLVSRHVDLVVHQRRAYGGRSSRSVMTVHGAKNREFDNVFVLWGYKLTPNKVQQRKLLYNAITRAVKNCVVLVSGNLKRAADDPILSLLGPAQSAVPEKAKAKNATRQSVKGR